MVWELAVVLEVGKSCGLFSLTLQLARSPCHVCLFDYVYAYIQIKIYEKIFKYMGLSCFIAYFSLTQVMNILL